MCHHTKVHYGFDLSTGSSRALAARTALPLLEVLELEDKDRHVLDAVCSQMSQCWHADAGADSALKVRT